MYDNSGAAAAVAILGGLFAFVFALIGIAFYIFFALSLYKLAQKRGLEMPWLAWIPIAQFYLIGKMVKSVKIGTFEVPSLEIVLPVGALIAAIIPILGTIVSIALFVLLIFTYLALYRQYVPENAVLYTVLSLLGIPLPFLFMKLSKMDPIMTP
jgi:hypothetical protein